MKQIKKIYYHLIILILGLLIWLIGLIFWPFKAKFAHKLLNNYSRYVTLLKLKLLL